MLKKLVKSIKKRVKEFKAYIKKGKKILVLSDSHGGVFEYINDNGLLSPHIINAQIVGGATAYGLANPDSATKAFDKFISALRRFNKYDIVLIQLGEVDCSFALWNKAHKEGGDVFEQLKYSLYGYAKLLDWLASNNYLGVIITGAVLPTLKDGQSAPEGAKLRDKISATQFERTKLVLELNVKLKELAASYDFLYFDITEETLDFDTGVIKEEFVYKDRIDHHHDHSESATLWLDKVRSLLV